MTDPTHADVRKLDAGEPAAREERRYGAAVDTHESIRSISDPDQKDPSNTEIRRLTAPLDPDDDVLNLVNTQGNAGDAPSGLR